jgi:hypothetical protein
MPNAHILPKDKQAQSRHLNGRMPDRHQVYAFCTFYVEPRLGQFVNINIFMILCDLPTY